MRYNPEYIVKLAQQMRGDMTPAEELLWARLRRRQINGLRFRRQRPAGRYIADFYCPELRLIIEIDGEIHLQQQEYDKNRDEFLKASNYTILRFSNKEILQDIENVITRIKSFSESAP